MESNLTEIKEQMPISTLGKSIIKAMLYYDIFSYPLTSEEIYHNIGTNHITPNDLREELNNLCSKGIIHNKRDFYICEDNEELINKRLKGNLLAVKRMRTAFRMSRVIAAFPFVRGILLSGSLSKGYMEKDSDIDYFVITHPNRVWISKLLLMLFKKTFLLNSKKMFCVNYFIDADNLEIEEKNIFTATELATLVPTFGPDFYDELYNKNIWVKQYFPNFPKRKADKILDKKNSPIKSLLEKTLSKKLGDKLDNFSMKVFERFNSRKYKFYNADEFKLAFKSNKNVSKHHPKFFQKRVLDEFNRKILAFEEKYKVMLS
jgi:hypothetical protein